MVKALLALSVFGGLFGRAKAAEVSLYLLAIEKLYSPSGDKPP
jgi:hypothetical protein